jgi:hypothetical protein
MRKENWVSVFWFMSSLFEPCILLIQRGGAVSSFLSSFLLFVNVESQSELPLASTVDLLIPHNVTYIYQNSSKLCLLVQAYISFLVSLTFSWRAKSWYGWECRWPEGMWSIYLFLCSINFISFWFHCALAFEAFTHQQSTRYGFFLEF